MKKNSILKYEIISTIFVMIFGVLLHFTYQWSDNNLLVGIFSAINESTWEHLKLIFYPSLITLIIGYFYIGKNSNYICSKVRGLLVSLIFIIIFYYTYTGVLGMNIGIINILSFFVAIIIGEFYSLKKIKTNTYDNPNICILVLILILISFILFTFFPPNIGIFKDPIAYILK